MNKKNAYIALALILLLGSFLRIYGLGNESFWLDESYTAKSVEFTVSDLIMMTYKNSTILPQYFGKGAGSVPFYYILTNYWTKLFGLSEFKLRLLSAIFGIFSIYLTYLLGKSLFNYETGLASAFVLSINHQHIFFSQEARMYSMLIALALLSTLFLLSSLKTNKSIYWAAFVVSDALLLYIHPFSFFILLFQGLFILICWKKYKAVFKKMLISGLAIFLIYLPWVPALFNQLSYGTPIGKVYGRPALSQLIVNLVQFNSWISQDIGTRAALRTMSFSELSFSAWMVILSVVIIVMLLGLAFIFGIINLVNKKNNLKLILLLLWFSIPIFVPFLISIVSPKNAVFSSVRYLLFASLPYYIIAALGISNMKRKPLFLILLVISSIFPLYAYYANFDKQQFREAAAYIVTNRSPDEYVFIHKSNIILPFSYYHHDLTNTLSIEDLNQLKSNLEGKHAFWIMLSMEKFSDPQGTIKQYLDSNYMLAKKTEFVDIKIFYYKNAKYQKNKEVL